MNVRVSMISIETTLSIRFLLLGINLVSKLTLINTKYHLFMNYGLEFTRLNLVYQAVY